MIRVSGRILGALTALLLFTGLPGHAAGQTGHAPANAGEHAPQIWFAPKQFHVQRGLAGPAAIDFGAYDFAQMLPPDAPWQNALARLSLLSINLHTIEHFPDLAAVVAMTARNRFLVATAGSVLFTGGLCETHGMEGMDRAEHVGRELVAGVRRWKAAGGRLDYLIMDSPLYFGYYASQDDCHFSIDEVARRSAATIAEIRQVYPNIKLMDAEGPGPVDVGTWLQDFDTWLQDFRRYAGQPIDNVGLDLHWSDDWHTGYDWISAARRSIEFLHQRGLLVGLTINAKDKGIESTAAWMAANRAHLAEARQANLALDYVIISSWSKNPNFPARNLPETDPDAYSSLIDYAASLYGK